MLDFICIIDFEEERQPSENQKMKIYVSLGTTPSFCKLVS